LFFDGALKRNLRQVGGYGVLIDPDENKEIKYAWGLEVSTSNEAEFLALFQGLRLTREREIKKLVIIGDSLLVIQQFYKAKLCLDPPEDYLQC